jgi:hypothetical protein
MAAKSSPQLRKKSKLNVTYKLDLHKNILYIYILFIYNTMIKDTG